jgi:glucuronoarabinoxylan endo-1,4-beta-xylanase
MLGGALSIQAQPAVYVVDDFNPSGTGGYSYSGGQITKVWSDWFGGALQSLSWDSTSDATTNASSGSMKITAVFNPLASSSSNQFEVYDGFSAFTPPLSGFQYTNFQCDVRFAAGSATTTNGGAVSFGHVQFGIITNNYGQDYFGGVDVSANDTNWVHVSIPIDASADPNLAQINDVLIHIYGPYYSGSPLNGASTLWVDNIQFVGVPLQTNGACTVDWHNLHQRIDGFGASSAWESTWTSVQADMFFSTNNGIRYTNTPGAVSTNNGVGLSLLRSRIAPGGTTVENSIMQMAQSRGAKVWSTPWSPAATFKNNGNVNGGSIIPGAATYQAYANQLAGYVATMQETYGVNLYAISVQNEPDADVSTYESCNWSAQEIHDFVPYLYNSLVASNVSSTRIMLPESQNWLDYSNLAVTAMSDTNVAPMVGLIACHNYDGLYGPTPLTKISYGKTLWESEVSNDSDSDGSITNGVYYGQRIHLFLTQAQVNAWHYWWLMNGLMDTNATPTKRMFALGQFSRFVRPGAYRIDATNNGAAQISAYKQPSGAFAIVAINSQNADISQVFTVTNCGIGSSVTPWVTSSNLSLAAQAAIFVTNSSFACTLPAMSVVTLVGYGSNSPPVLLPVANQTISAGVILALTNVATDPDQPLQQLTFSAITMPTNATLDPSSGLFTWRPLVSQANTTNLIQIEVTDNGMPPLSATNSFSVVVNPVVQPTLSSPIGTRSQVSLVVNGASGLNYALETSTNLTSWQTVLTTNPLSLPITFIVTNQLEPQRYYRIQLGP